MTEYHALLTFIGNGGRIAEKLIFATRQQAADSTDSTEPILLPPLAAYKIALCEQGAATP